LFLCTAPFPLFLFWIEQRRRRSRAAFSPRPTGQRQALACGSAATDRCNLVSESRSWGCGQCTGVRSPIAQPSERRRSDCGRPSPLGDFAAASASGFSLGRTLLLGGALGRSAASGCFSLGKGRRRSFRQGRCGIGDGRGGKRGAGTAPFPLHLCIAPSL
ncbi:unnamed protein product, partial [Musa textilis]